MRNLKANLAKLLPALIFPAIFAALILTGLIDEARLITVSFIIYNIFSSVSDLRQRVIFIVFNLTFLFFLLFRGVFEVIFPEIVALSVSPVVDPDIEIYAEFLIFLTIYIIRLSYFQSLKAAIPIANDNLNTNYIKVIRRWSEILIYVLIPFNLAVLFERISFVNNYGYDASYVSYASELPLVFVRIASLFEAVLILNLATFPSRRRTYIHLVLYVVVGAGSLGFGQRNGFVLSIVFAIIYLAIRDVVTPSKRRWLSATKQFYVVAVAVGLVPFFAAYAYTRSQLDISLSSFGELIGLFFVSQSSSIFNVSYAIELKDLFPPGKLYSLGPIMAFLHDNIISQTIFGTEVYPAASSELALNGNNFSFALAYLVNPTYYESGGGFGSNFIAELWVDFGLVGVFFGAALYGFLMGRFLLWISTRGPIFTAFCFLGVIQLIYSPRAEFLGFMSPMTSILTVLIYLLIHVAASRSREGSGHRF